MQHGQVPGVNKSIPRIVQGTVMLSSDSLDENLALLDDIFEQGGTAFDTAQSYGNGDVERVLGQWLQSRGVRDEVMILDKGAHHSRDRQRVTPFDISADLHDSLARLHTDYIDLYILHRDDPSQPVEPIVDVLNEHRNAGRIHAFGGSNWSVARIREANAYAERSGQQGFVASSPNFSLAVQIQAPWANCISISGPAAADERAWYAEQNMPLFTWSSLAGGFFSGRFRRENLDDFETYLDKLAVTTYASDENFQRLERVQTLADEYGMTIPQIATAYVLSYPLNIFALIGCRTGDEFRANKEASELTLSEQEIAWLELKTDERG